MPDRRLRYRLSVVSRGGVRHGTAGPRMSKMLEFLTLLTQEEAQELAALLRLDQQLAGDWLERRGKPRTWRKHLRVTIEPASGAQ